LFHNRQFLLSHLPTKQIVSLHPRILPPETDATNANELDFLKDQTLPPSAGRKGWPPWVCWSLIGANVVVLLCLCWVGYLVFFGSKPKQQPSRVTKANYDKIHEGMSEQDVTTILGHGQAFVELTLPKRQPETGLVPIKEWSQAFQESVLRKPNPTSMKSVKWVTSRCMIEVTFSDGVVKQKSYEVLQ